MTQKQTPWNKGLSANPNHPNYDPRVAKNVQGLVHKNKFDHAPGWNKGLTKETDPRLAQYGLKISKTRKEKNIKPWNKGLNADTNNPNYDERVAINGENTGKTLRELYATDQLIPPRKGTFHSEESIAKMSASHKGNKSWCKGLTKYTHKSLMSSSKKMRIIAVNRKGSFPRTNTSIEVELQNALIQKNIPFITDKPIMNVTRVDIFINPNLCVYADGDYWHKLPGKKEKDEKINKVLTENGFMIFRFWGSEIRENPNKCIETIIEYMKTIL